MGNAFGLDWGLASEAFDAIVAAAGSADLTSANEAQTRFDVIDRLLKEVLGWTHGQISVEERVTTNGIGYVDYILRSGDSRIVVEAKRAGATFPSPTKRRHLKVAGSVLTSGDVKEAIDQARTYATEKEAQVIVVTNGHCWICYSMVAQAEDAYAIVFFPFSGGSDAEGLFRLLSEGAVAIGSLISVTNQPPRVEERLLTVLRDADGRVDRNNIADHITPALTNALYADALLSNDEALQKCFVTTEARSKFDTLLGMHLSDPKPALVQPARRIRTGKQGGELESIVQLSKPGFAPPVTLIIGPVGAGKSTYLRHFQAVAGKKLLRDAEAHWIYVDFERMGKGGNPRAFLYSELRAYLLADHPDAPTDYKSLVEPAYAEEVAGLARGPLAPIFLDKAEFNKRVVDHIKKDFEAVEPYVDKLLKHLATVRLCVVVLDNVDLYEDEALETAVFAEGLGLSKRCAVHVIACIRDRTFVRHRNDASFDAYELRKLWLDPPPFKAVLSARLTYSRKVLEGRSAQVHLANGMHLNVPDLSVFFDIVQRSILQSDAGDYVEAVADLNIRRGLQLVV